jgi:purine-cytosine permease-like protein
MATDRETHHPGANEYEDLQVPASAFKGPWSFVGIFAGEHIAGTEFMIGPLFLAAGVGAFDLLAGLLLGNLLAVLSWAFVCAPIATRFRLTLYAKLRMICGSRLLLVYNLANGVLFCILAGAMVSVSATAVGLPFHMPMPALTDWLPTSVEWVVIVAAIGALFAFVAAWGYDAMARVAAVAAPFMILVFIACGVVALSELGVTSVGEFLSAAGDRIWRGGDPLPGQTKFTFWHVVFFAWFCNAAMHLGLADLSIFRYARKWTYGFASAAGMFVGHYLAWISASLLYAAQLARDPSNTTVAPGPLAYGAVGISGLICVVLAGWTTANPTIYRAGLAFQALFPSRSRFAITLVAGGIATIGAVFPALVMRLLDFVGLYGTILMPMGAIIVAEVVLFPRFGLPTDWAERTGAQFNAAAAWAWGLALAICALLNVLAGVQIFFLALPGWCAAGVFYLLLSAARHRRAAPIISFVRQA